MEKPTWRVREELRRQAERAIEGRASFEEHVRPARTPLRIEVDPRELLQVLDESEK